MTIILSGKILFDKVYHNIGDSLSAILDIGFIKDRSPDDNYVLLNSRMRKDSASYRYNKVFREKNEILFETYKGFLSRSNLYSFNLSTNELKRISAESFKNVYGTPICYNNEYYGLDYEYYKWLNITKITLNKYSSHKVKNDEDIYTESKTKYIFGNYLVYILRNFFICLSNEDDKNENRTIKIYSTKGKNIKLISKFKVKNYTYISQCFSETEDSILISNYKVLHVLNKKTKEVKKYDIDMDDVNKLYVNINLFNGHIIFSLGNRYYKLTDNGVEQLDNILKNNGLEKYSKNKYSIKSLGNNLYLVTIVDIWFIIREEKC